ncbi:MULTISPECIES: IclR family transcriptional regulator [Sphingopyxis]|uniref:IclR family transcriptional regulator n=1 Tax=Sphingopyxis TaxID=165697 RepID=UPI00131A1B66|nr:MULTISPECIES: IclR family transcriptional regulator [Sphingopyxis]QUM73190.1 IclR family transcriptional regulator [Sphingopyxis granuli]
MPRRKTEQPSARAKATRRKTYSAPALEKGLDIIELLAKEPEAISLKEIAERLQRSVGEIFRMLAVLEQRGFVRTQQGTERYQLSMKLFQLAHWHLPVNVLTRAAAEPMRRLALQSGQSCHLAIHSDSKMVAIAQQSSYRDRNFSIKVGAEAPILTSCSGRIFFALSDDAARETLLTNIAQDGGDIALAKKISGLEKQIRASKILEMPSNQIEGITDVGAPIFSHSGTISAALVVPFLYRKDQDNKTRLEETRRLLLETVREISMELGYEEL